MFNISIAQISETCIYDQMCFTILFRNQIKSNVGFRGAGKTQSTRRKTSQSRVENQQTQPTYSV